MSSVALPATAGSFCFGNKAPPPLAIFVLMAVGLLLLSIVPDAFGQIRIPGADESGKLEAAGTLLRILDTGIFVWGARLCAGVMIFSAGINLKEQRFGIAIICIIGALVIGTAPMWVKNIFEIGGGSVFSYLAPAEEINVHA